MKRMDEKSQIKQATELWIANYGLDSTYKIDDRGRSIGRELMSLNQETATAAQVTEIIGNPNWVYKLECDECGKEIWDIVEVGEESDHDAVYLCLDCLKKAVQLLENSVSMVKVV